MTNEERRAALANRIELAEAKNQSLAVSDNYKTKTETQKRMKCTECGKGYLGQSNSSTCGPTCRQRKSRG